MNFLENPNLPNRRVKGVLLDYRTEEKIQDACKELGLDLYFTSRVHGLDEAVCGHPDMSFHHLGGNAFLCAPESYQCYKQMFSALSMNLFAGKSKLTSTYPFDVAYNVARVKNYAFHNLAYTDATLAAALAEQGVQTISVAQGYSKCNICFINQKAFITEDESIYKAAVKHGFDVLKIRAGFIRLNGYPYGFLGGASGLLDRDLLAVTGSLKIHPQYHEIVQFCEKYQVKICELSDQEPIDFGSILPLYYA